MRGLLIIATAAAVLLQPAVGEAQGRGNGRDQDRAERFDRDHGDRGRRREWRDEGPPRFRERDERPRRRDRDEGPPRFRDRDPEDYEPPRYEPRPDARRYREPRDAPPPIFRAGPPGPGRSWRRGERLPPMYRGSVVRDPRRFRLRTPPPGYDWINVGPGVYLVQRSSGLVLDAIPNDF